MPRAVQPSLVGSFSYSDIGWSSLFNNVGSVVAGPSTGDDTACSQCPRIRATINSTTWSYTPPDDDVTRWAGSQEITSAERAETGREVADSSTAARHAANWAYCISSARQPSDLSVNTLPAATKLPVSSFSPQFWDDHHSGLVHGENKINQQCAALLGNPPRNCISVRHNYRTL